MKKTFAAAAMIAALASPAFAQYQHPYGPPPGGNGYGPPPGNEGYGPPPPPGDFWYGAPQHIRDRVGFLANRLQRLRDSGRLTPGAYYNFKHDLDVVSTEESQFRYRNGGQLTPPERENLNRKLHNISSHLSWNSHLGY